MKEYVKIIRLFCISLCFYMPVLQADDIKIGISYYNPPFIFNTKQGLDIDLMNVICQKINRKCTFLQMKYTDLFSSLKSREIELAIGALSITDEKKSDFYFSLPYMLNSGQFLIDNKDNIKSIDDLAGQKVGVFRGDKNGALYYDYLVNTYGNQFQIISYDNANQLIADFQNNTLQALFVNQDSARYWVYTSFGKLKTLGVPVVLGDGIAIAALPENKDLVQQINKVLQELETNGDYLRLYKTYIQD